MSTFFVSALLAILSTQAQAATNLAPSAEVPTQYIWADGFIDGRIQPLPEPPDFSLVWPTLSHRISRGVSNGHTGVDIDGNTNDAVYAVFTGEVTTISNGGPYGNKIIIAHPEHPDQLTTLYAHLDTITVASGQKVETGQQIGTVGTTGYATGSHLHVEIFKQGTLASLQSWF